MLQTSVMDNFRSQVFKVRIYNAMTDEFVVSRRMATVTGAKIMGGEIMPETRTLINSNQLVRGEHWTEKDFVPED